MLELENSMKLLIQPCQSGIASYPSLYKSAIAAGDVECAMKIGWLWCSASFYMGTTELSSLTKQFQSCLNQQRKYHQTTTGLLTMAAFGPTIHLSGQFVEGVKGFDELREVGKSTNNHLLVWQVYIHQMATKFW